MILWSACQKLRGASSLSWYNLANWRTPSAVYFDHKRRNDPNFRKQLKKESRKQARAAKEEAEAQSIRARGAARQRVEEAKEEGFPDDSDEKEAYFMQEVQNGEVLSQDGMMIYKLKWTVSN